jgi:hypothetical protein
MNVLQLWRLAIASPSYYRSQTTSATAADLSIRASKITNATIDNLQLGVAMATNTAPIELSHLLELPDFDQDLDSQKT